MTRSIWTNFINNKLAQYSCMQSQDEEFHMDINPGGDCAKVKHSSKHVLGLYKNVETLIVVAGTNDISYETAAGSVDAEAIAEGIMDIGREALRDYDNVKHVCISSIIFRGSSQYSETIFDTNMKLRLKCKQEGFIFIDNDIITVHDLVDGLHLNKFGNDKFIHNLLSCCASYNPCFNNSIY